MSGTTTRTVGALPAATTLPSGSEVVALVPDATVSGGKAARRATATLFQGPAGPQGPQGVQGIQGPAGPTGPAGPAGPGTGGTTFNPATLPVGSALAATDEGVIVQGGTAKRASLGAMATAAGLSPGALPVSAALAGANELMLTQAGSVTRLTLDALVTYLQGRLGTTGGGGGTTTTGGGTTTPTTPTWTLRTDYTPSGGLTAYGAVGNGWVDAANTWRVSADNRLESNSTWLDPWANNHIVRGTDTTAINQRIQARFTAQTDCIIHFLARATGAGTTLSGLACSVQPAGWFRVDPIVGGVRGELFGADGTVTMTPGTLYDMRVDVVQSGSTTNVTIAFFAATAGTALCSGTQLNSATVPVNAAAFQNTAGTVGMFWYAEVEGTPTFVDRFSWFAA